MSLVISPENVIASCALLTGIVSIIYTAKSLKIQRKHNYKSISPIASIDIGDYETDLYVRIGNKGIGPMILQDVKISVGSKTSDSLIKVIPDEIKSQTIWTTFASNVNNETVKVDDYLYLIRLKLSHDDTNTEDSDLRNSLREFLQNVRISIKYTDLYLVNEYNIEKDLTWFGRRLNSNSPRSIIE